MLIALLACVLAQNETIFYHFPESAKEPEVQKSIKALSSRIEDAKFSGIKVLPLKRDSLWAVGIQSAGPIGENLSGALLDLATIRANKIELLLKREMNAQEADLYKPGETAPAGCMWKSWNGTPILFENTSVDISAGLRFSEGDKLQQHPHIAAGVPYLELSPLNSAKLEKPEILKRGVLTIDGAIVNSVLEYHHPYESVRGMRITGNFLHNKLLGICINHPLALELKKQH